MRHRNGLPRDLLVCQRLRLCFPVLPPRRYKCQTAPQVVNPLRCPLLMLFGRLLWFSVSGLCWTIWCWISGVNQNCGSPFLLKRLATDLTRRLKTPKLLWQWIEISPAILLVLAVVAFLAGLILWAFASSQVTPNLSLFRSLELTSFRQG